MFLKKASKNYKKKSIQKKQRINEIYNFEYSFDNDEDLKNNKDQRILKDIRNGNNNGKFLFIKTMNDSIINYSEKKGIKKQFLKWMKDRSCYSYQQRFQWIRSIYDIDYFFRDIGIS